MSKTSLGVALGFLATTSAVLWAIYSYATTGALDPGRPAPWIVAILAATVLTVLFVRQDHRGR